MACVERYEILMPSMHSVDQKPIHQVGQSPFGCGAFSLINLDPKQVQELEDAAPSILMNLGRKGPSCMLCGARSTPVWRLGGYLPSGQKRVLW
jgi:hypothetical protein